MEVVAAARLHLLEQGSIKNLVQKRVWKFEPENSLEGTGQAALILNVRGGWSKPGMNSQEYPMLVVECASDHSRNAEKQVIEENASERCYQIAREVDQILHQVDREVRRWPNRSDGLLVLGSFRGSEPTEPADKWGVKVVRLTYDLQVIHGR